MKMKKSNGVMCESECESEEEGDGETGGRGDGVMRISVIKTI
jgi:hypothetical protein